MRVVEVKAKYVVAECLEVLRESPDRVEPFCGVFGICGGCQVQHLAYEAQLRWKRDTVSAALERIGGIEHPPVRETIGMAEPRAYRNKMSLVVDESGAQARLGFYQARSHELVPIEDCPIVLPALQRDLRELVASAADPARRGLFTRVRHVVVRRARSGGTGVAALTTRRPEAALVQPATRLRERLPDMRTISNSYDIAGENVILGRRERLLAGQGAMEERLSDLRFQVSVQSFFQVNSEMVERIFDVLAARVSNGLRILDLYCGAGTFAIYFASRGAVVTGFEENPQAVAEARANAARNGVAETATFTAGRVEALLREGSRQARARETDAVFLDPPRKGSDGATLEWILSSEARAVWYLSCNPATLARDAAILAAGGMRMVMVQPFDMFPQTGHVEVLAVFERGNAAAQGSAVVSA